MTSSKQILIRLKSTFSFLYLQRPVLHTVQSEYRQLGRFNPTLHDMMNLFQTCKPFNWFIIPRWGPTFPKRQHVLVSTPAYTLLLTMTYTLQLQCCMYLESRKDVINSSLLLKYLKVYKHLKSLSMFLYSELRRLYINTSTQE